MCWTAEPEAWPPLPCIILGKAANKPSIRVLVMSTNCLETRHLPLLVVMPADNKTLRKEKVLSVTISRPGWVSWWLTILPDVLSLFRSLWAYYWTAFDVNPRSIWNRFPACHNPDFGSTILLLTEHQRNRCMSKGGNTSQTIIRLVVCSNSNLCYKFEQFLWRNE